MAHAFQYKPRFKDIRIKPPREEAAKATGVRVCDWADCRAPGTCRAPKGPEKLNEFYMFCPAHAAEYNRNWDFFAGMAEADVESYQASASTGHRPTWRMGTSGQQNQSAGRARTWGQAFTDPFGLFSGGGRSNPTESPRKRRLGRLEEAALQALGFDGEATAQEIRARYKTLVKRFHPDANGGDRTTEERLGQVIRAYQTLKKAGMG